VWAKPLMNGDIAAVVFNRSPTTLIANLTWEMLGVPPSTPLELMDLWAGKSLGVHSAVYVTPVAPHDVVMVRASAPPQCREVFAR
jgi:hypothetical protein